MTFKPLTDEEWSAIAAVIDLPREGRPYKDLRTTVDGIRWRLFFDRPWREVPEHFGKWNSVYRYWRRHREDNAFRLAMGLPPLPSLARRRAA